MRIRAPLLALLALSGCIPAREAPPAPPPAPAPIVAAPPPAAPPATSDWRDWPLTPGTWNYRRDDRGSVASFGTGGVPASLTLRCDQGARRVALSRSGGAVAPLAIRTTSVTRSLAVQPIGTEPAVAALAATDPLLDAIGFSRGRFVVEQAGAPTLVIPAWAEIERVIEDCRG